MMKAVEVVGYLMILLLVEPGIKAENVHNISEVGQGTTNETSHQIYKLGVDLGIINTEKYPFIEFRRDEWNVFKDLYNVYVTTNGSLPINYEEWLVMNNFGILSDTQESMFSKKITKRSTADNKRRFLQTVRKGDILISGRGIGGIVGHAAIMTADNIVLEMPGGDGWWTVTGIKDNNRQLSASEWFDEHASDWTTVYRCPDNGAARDAATWADHNYYNPSGGSKKTIHVTYHLTTDHKAISPSYCSKLIIQAYYYGTGNRKVIKDLSLIGKAIVPSTIPEYFLPPYKLVNKGRY